MLKHLLIKNYALIEQIGVDFEYGFSVVTGETGSGKSVILGALGLLMGERADTKSLKDESKKSVVEGTFHLNDSTFGDFFTLNDLDFEEQTIIRREIAPNGKSRAFVNDTPVNLNLLKELGDKLVDIHSQHQTILLGNRNFQFEVLDIAADALSVRNDYLLAFKEYKLLINQLAKLKEHEAKANTDKDYYSFLLNDFEGIDLEKLNIQELEEEYKLLENAEEIIQLLGSANETLNGENNAVLSGLKSVLQNLDRLATISDHYEQFLTRVRSVIIELEDLEGDLSRAGDKVDISEIRYQELSSLFDKLYGLQKKHNAVSLSDLVTKKLNLEEKLSSITSISASIAKKEQEVTTQYKIVEETGRKLTEFRIKGVQLLEAEIQRYLAGLAMPNAALKVELEAVKEPSVNGYEQITFLVKTNKGSNWNPIQKIASGGELSRIMLSIKAILSKSNAKQTIVFDEIDTGVSGEVANKMGEMMLAMGESMQVISITHLPQIASKGKYHYKVEKLENDEGAFVQINSLSAQDRLIEIAKILSGEEPTEAALQNAKELLKQ